MRMRFSALSVGDVLFFLSIVAVGAISTWPIYSDVWFLVTVGTALLCGGVIAVVGATRGLSAWPLVGITFGVYVCVGIPVAVPSVFSDPGHVLIDGVNVLTAPVTGWKNILTLPLPLGSFQATLAPAFFLFLGVTVAALSLAWRAEKLWVLAAPVSLLLPIFGIAFGSSFVYGFIRLGVFTFPGVVEMSLGIAAVLVSVGWYVWRQARQRRRSLQSQSVRTVRLATRADSSSLLRVLIGLGMVVIATVVAVIVAPFALASQSRDVLRVNVDPHRQIDAQLSPLSTYRQFFDAENYDAVMFRVTTEPFVLRVRLATLSFYNGVTANVADSTSQSHGSGTFSRVPSDLPAAGYGVDANVSIEGYRGAWVPIVGQLTGMTFTGSERAALSDGFFYSTEAQMGVELSDPGLTSGTKYREKAVISRGSSIIALSEAQPSLLQPQIDSDIVPQSVKDWINAQNVSRDGAGLQTLIDRLRARGYLSHALSIDSSAPPAWVSDLNGYTFSPSAAGHSTDRIGQIFQGLLKRQQTAGGVDDADLVAAVGDDEQFAVAAMMLADQLGFPSRVVLGAQLSGDDSESIPPCTEGICRGKNMTAWLEVRDSSGMWIPVSVTPQHTVPPARETQLSSDPFNGTDVTPQYAQGEQPPVVAPGGGDAPVPPANEAAKTASWLAALLTGFLIACVIAVVVAGPFVVIMVIKLFRRRFRRARVVVVDRFVEGWNEYVDTAVDHGAPVLRARTREEIARAYDTQQQGYAMTLARSADRAVFDERAPSDHDSAQFWAIIDSERQRLSRQGSWWQRMRARISLRSFRR